MKKFLQRASKSFAAPNIPSIPLPSILTPIAPHTTGLQPKYLVPPVPHPAPHAHLALLVTHEGLLIRPHLPNQNLPPSASYIRIPWDKTAKVEEVTGSGNHDWDDSVIVYGIVGVLELFSCSYILVVTGRTELGTLFEPTHVVYSVKSVVAIPLVQNRATIVVNTLSARNEAISRPSLMTSTTLDTISSPESAEHSDEEENGPNQPSTARVQFSSTDQIKIMSPVSASFHDGGGRPSSPTPSDMSGASTPTSETSASPMAPIAKALAARLSFWSRLSKRTTLFPPTPDPSLSDSAEPVDLDSLIEEGDEVPAEVLGTILDATAPAPESTEEKHSELEDKIVKECIREFVKGGMYFAYNFDITRSLQHKQDQTVKSKKQNELLADLMPSSNSAEPIDITVNPLSEPFPTLPLWRRVDRQFWWNESLSKPFIDAGAHPYVLPIMQGYYQISSFHIPSDSADEEECVADYVIVSRRSRDRAGLRYQRRGIDDDAHVANFVETETIMRIQRDGLRNIFSYVQIRGSVPLFWTQSGYGLKPPPVLATDRTHLQNVDAMRRHFKRTVPEYGPHSIINLAEQHGREGVITQGYKECTAELNDKDVQYNEYDFHSETKGMKYENISKLIELMERIFEHQGYLWISDGIIMSRQKGVFRVNCIDCLDRTNVVQSAFSRYVLNEQLSALALHAPSAEARSTIDVIFNDLWANNGDAISRAYSGTSALKGDFTRTGKRDLTGMLNDGVNSLARMYSSTFSDWFCQAVIDFMLGNRSLAVFSEFLLKLQSSDPRDLIRLSKIRQEAIATSVERVLTEGERLLGGWTLFSPEELNVKMADKFEEKILLLTARALYIISFDYTLEKVKLYTRVPLGDIVEIAKGPYILSPLEEASRDPMQNAGFVISWLNNNQITRVTSYSVRNTVETPMARGVVPATLRSLKTPKAFATAAMFDVRRNVMSATLSKKTNATVLSNILNTASMSMNGSEQTFAAFKMLPIDPTRTRRATSDGGSDNIETELNEASSCKEAVDLLIDTIRRACDDIGSGHKDFVVEKDVVSLAEAQNMTSMYAKMEYGVKRLLWLGG
ncbi:SacI homology domain-containing protein [Mycena floridula]|nr:SacI homology domain-containing protein [Mycena floridula]